MVFITYIKDRVFQQLIYTIFFRLQIFLQLGAFLFLYYFTTQSCFAQTDAFAIDSNIDSTSASHLFNPVSQPIDNSPGNNLEPVLLQPYIVPQVINFTGNSRSEPVLNLFEQDHQVNNHQINLFTTSALLQPLQHQELIISDLVQPSIQPELEPPSLSDEDTINVKQYVFEYADGTGGIILDYEGVFSQERLARVTEPFLGNITFEQLLAARSSITQLYIDNGFITSGAYIPEQTFIDQAGIIRIRIIEGTLDCNFERNITIHPPADSRPQSENRYLQEFLESPLLNQQYIANQLGSDFCRPFNINVLQDSLRLLRLNPLISEISSTLQTGSRPGESQLQIEIWERPERWGALFEPGQRRYGLELSLDNNRSPAVGSVRGRFQFSAIPRDQQYLSGVFANMGLSLTSGSQEIAFEMGIDDVNNNFDALVRIGGSSDSQVIEEPFNELDINSPSLYWDVTGRYQFTSTYSEDFAIGATAGWQENSTSVRGIDIPLSPGANNEGFTRSTAVRVFGEWTRRSEWEASYLRSQVSLGLGILSAINATGPDSRYLAWQNQAQWIARLAPDTFFVTRINLQLANDNLLSLDQFAIGGQETVRGYRQDLLIADNGFNTSVELQLPLFRQSNPDLLVQIITFFDYGCVWNSRRVPDPDPSRISSVGLGLLIQQGEHIQARIDWGLPLINVDSQGDSLQENGIYFSLIWSPL